MANENEPAKLLLPYLQRADELQKHEPLVAYYCRLYAMERGLRIPQSERTKTTNSLLISLMKQLEKDKKSLTLGPDDSLHIEGFALNVFGKADKQDRAGRADKSTAKTFYAASIFFEILNQFGQLQPDLEQKQKYAAWKAADISKALKEGRKPVPGPPGGNNEDATPNTGYDIEPSRIDPATRPAPEFDQSTQVHDKVEPTQTSNIPPVPPSNIPPSPYPTNNYVSHNFPQPPSADDYPSHSFHQPPSSDDYPSHSFHQPPSSDDYPSHSLHQPPSGDDYPSHSFHQPPPTDDYPSHNFLQPPPVNKSENSTYSQPPYQHQPFPLEPQQHSPQYQPPETNYSYLPNFQTYPSFTETSLPAAPSHVPSYYQGSDSSYSAPPASGTPNYPSTAQLSPNARNGPISDTAPTSAQGYQYDSNYQPPPEKIAEAHKAARFAVGALAFDDVSIAVDYLRKSLELLTNPSAGQ